MAENKKYYYLKLKDNFFESDELVLLESLENGYLYSNILLKLYLKSLKNDGCLMLKERIPYNLKMLSRTTRHNQDVVSKALTVFKELGLVEILDNGAIFMLDIQNYIGHGSSEGERKAKYRKRIEDQKQKLLNGGTLSQEIPDERPLEKEIDIDKEKEIKTNTRACKNSTQYCKTNAGVSTQYGKTNATKGTLPTTNAKNSTLQTTNAVAKIKYAEFVNMKLEEYQKLCSQFGEDKTKRMIEVLDNYKGSKGKNYKDDYRAILSWVIDKVENESKPVIKASIPQHHNFGQRPNDISDESFFTNLVEKYNE